jgi:hypothetical protein
MVVLDTIEATSLMDGRGLVSDALDANALFATVGELHYW